MSGSMIGIALSRGERRLWSAAGGVVLVAHMAVAALVLALARPHETIPEEPVITIELPPMAAMETASAVAEPVQPQPQPEVVQPVTPPIDVPRVSAPLPRDALVLPPTPPQPVRAAPAPAPAAAPAPAVQSQVVPTVAGPMAGDPRARKAELDYFSQLSAYLNRRKSYPAEAKKARQEGVVTVRFTVDREGGVAAAGIKRSSGFDLLDAATLDLLRRVAPLPRMPAAMLRDSVTIALPIEYSLKTS